MVRIIGVDFGERRTGVAVSDPMGWTAQGLEAVTGNMDGAAARVAQLIKDYGAGVLVVGNPKNMDGTEGFRAKRTDDFISSVKRRLGAESGTIEIVKWDERLTSMEAKRTLKETGVRVSSRAEREKGRLDILSAAILLQSYLDSSRRTD